jgi:hypothetical protein
LKNNRSIKDIGLVNRSYYYQENEKDVYHKNINKCLDPDDTNIIEVSSVLSIMMKNYIVGNNTLIKGVAKTDWMSSIENGNCLRGELANHGENKFSIDKLIPKLTKALEKELLLFTDQKDTIGILLSGGMDSRVIAGVLRKLQLDKSFNGKVVAITWGGNSSRDVIYARQISKQFSWDFYHIPLNAEMLKDNLLKTADVGAEFSPIHLHGMLEVSKLKGVDGILAASYGDSIGRGEYSGKKPNELTSLLGSHFNKYGFLKKSVSKTFKKELEGSINYYHQKFPRNQRWQYNEIDQQAHYMRRQLGACMDLIDDKIKLYQMFTHPDVYSLMWSLNVNHRSDLIYYELLKVLPGNLLDIPWARDGKLFYIGGTVKDEYEPEHNKYGKWLREDCRDLVQNMFESETLINLGLFNERTLKLWSKSWDKIGTETYDRIDERVAWLVSFEIFAKKYNLKSDTEFKESKADRLVMINEYTHGLLYKGLRKFSK